MFIYIYIYYVISSNFKELLRSLVGDGRPVGRVSCFKTQTPNHQGYIKVFCLFLTKKSSKYCVLPQNKSISKDFKQSDVHNGPPVSRLGIIMGVPGGAYLSPPA